MTGQPEPGKRAEHWESVYLQRGTDGVSWFQPVASMSVELIDALGVAPDQPVVDAGGGASPLAANLVDRGFTDVSVLDLSKSALESARDRLGPQAPVAWLHQDVLGWRPPRRFGLWHDRAVFHFLTDPGDRERYLAVLRFAVAPGGAVVLATFAPDGPEYCSGLPVARYSAERLADLLDGGFQDFQTVRTEREEHVTPSGAVQSFTWLAGRLA